MEKRNTIQKELVQKAVFELKRHVTADEVYEYIKRDYPRIGRGTVYRNLGILADEGVIGKVAIPNGADRFDITVKKHYHVICVKCGKIFDVDMDEIPDIKNKICNTHGVRLLDYDIIFKGLCSVCDAKNKEV